MKRISMIVLALVLAISLVAVGCSEPTEEEEEVFLSFGTCAPGGTWYPVGAGMSVAIEDNTDLRVTAESTGCSLVNTRLVGRGELDFGITTGFVPFAAMAGTGAFEDDGPMPGIRCLIQIWGTAYHYVTTTGSGITELSAEALQGKRFGCAPVGDSGDVYTRTILEDVLGMDIEEDLAVFLNQDPIDNVDALADGVVDIIHINGSLLGTAGVIEAFARIGDAVLLPMPGDVFADFQALNPEVFLATVPAGNYGAGQTEALQVFVCAGSIIANIDYMDNATAYEVTRGIHEGLPGLAPIHPGIAEMTDDYIVLAAFAYHPGAIEYYEDVGIWPG